MALGHVVLSFLSVLGCASKGPLRLANQRATSSMFTIQKPANTSNIACTQVSQSFHASTSNKAFTCITKRAVNDLIKLSVS